MDDPPLTFELSLLKVETSQLIQMMYRGIYHIWEEHQQKIDFSFSARLEKKLTPIAIHTNVPKKTQILGVFSLKFLFLRSEPNKTCKISEQPGRFKARNKTKGVW